MHRSMPAAVLTICTLCFRGVYRRAVRCRCLVCRTRSCWSHTTTHTCQASIRLVLPVQVAHILPPPQLIFPSETWFFGIYLNFQRQNSLKNQYLPHSESRSYQIKSIKSRSSRSFQQHQRPIPIPPKFSATI